MSVNHRQKAWWSSKWGEDQFCPIYNVRLRPGKNKKGKPYVISLTCGHRFCRAAILGWKEKNNTCPICRRKIIFKELK